jgi:transcriptional regulator
MANKEKLIVTNPKLLLDIIKNYPLATVITNLNGSIEISHLPLIAEELATGNLKLRGHLSTKNPQWEHLKNSASMTVIFNGPNAYVNSSWYLVNDVSTWNYVTVHASGTAVAEESYEELLEILKATTDLANQLHEDQWDFYVPVDLSSEQELTAAIAGFSLEPSLLHGRFKLSQSKSIADQKRIIEKLSQRKDESSRSIASLMMRNME